MANKNDLTEDLSAKTDSPKVLKARISASKTNKAPTTSNTPKTRKTRKIDTYASQAGISKEKFAKTAVKYKNFKGSAFIHKLWVTMVEKGDSPKDLAAIIGIAYSYLMLLAKGGRDPSGLPLDSIRKSAIYMGIPMAQAALMAEIMVPADFYLDLTIPERVEIVHRDLQRDALYGGFALKPNVWHELPLEAKLLIAVLYENGSKTKYLDAAKMVSIVKSTPPA